ncbi:branched-chain amino acid ABC transporter permease [Paenalcaligenes niemegkensis]|uniref:branched-chain amino acid ABC transporter permease n=1 Tax=Paenalcaligenes niemegkensis TaxID=2895469 RepID=UPI001EE8B692|nr:branched-chain amino acid ABC transporter permease [Paenalcaligenes niemegkensis]MCQ9616382.1 branched-chain amino acid ABC transporter permease [Paenalcaligenes niemegkensis]
MSLTKKTALAAFGLILITLPLWANTFWLSSVATRALILGLMALSLNFLFITTGLVSLAQAAVATSAAYTVGLLSANSSYIGIELHPLIAIILALGVGTLGGFIVGLISLRSSGIYLLMITLATSMCLFYFVSQNITVFNGFDGVNGLRAPSLGTWDFRQRELFYFLCLLSSLVLLLLCRAVERSVLGSVLHGFRNAPLRMAALGFNTTTIRLIAFSIAGWIAATGGILNAWHTGQVSPGSTDVMAAVNLLIVAVLGGVWHPAGAFIGALFFVLLENFATGLIGRERFNLVIGISFVLAVIYAPRGLLGVYEKVVNRLKTT